MSTMIQEPRSAAADTQDLAAFGYAQQLRRRLGPYASFAAGFSFVSILTTVFQLFVPRSRPRRRLPRPPVATPIDPRPRLVTTKYNPARTWTPENAVGIGGAYLCIYGMEGPGGYQFVGRTIPVWRRQGEDPPWLLRQFDRINWYRVSAERLLELREDPYAAAEAVSMSNEMFTLAELERLLTQEADDIAAFSTRQAEAFAAERARWAASGELAVAASP